jgi:hypothetical protein
MNFPPYLGRRLRRGIILTAAHWILAAMYGVFAFAVRWRKYPQPNVKLTLCGLDFAGSIDFIAIPIPSGASSCHPAWHMRHHSLAGVLVRKTKRKRESVCHAASMWNHHWS